MPPVLPGATIGFFGGGQLGRMTGYAARAMGYDLRVLDPDPAPPAAVVASRTIMASFDDAEAAEQLARGCAVVTAEIEKIGPAALEAALRHAPVRPAPEILRMVQDRARQKRWLADHGFPLGAWAAADSAEDAERAARETGAPAVLKLCRGGYDGRGQARADSPDDVRAAWQSLGGPVVVERLIDLEAELSVLVARRPSGETVVHPPSRNHHERGVLHWAVVPSGLPRETLREAERIARGIAEEAQLEGLLCVELFLARDGRVLVNELAPRPHNSYHHSERALATGQFEQLVRAVCDLPLGAPDLVSPAAIVNMLGDLWEPAAPDFARALETPTARLHLYGKASARAGRKMGHVSAVGATADEALSRVLRAHASLTKR